MLRVKFALLALVHSQEDRENSLPITALGLLDQLVRASVEDDVCCQAGEGGVCACAATTPKYDLFRGELSLDGKFVHRFRLQAKNQIAILTAFEESDWPEWIDDPLYGRSGTYSEKRSHNAVYMLNLASADAPIRFQYDAHTREIGWIAVVPWVK
jgi:hypothetical protein